MMAVDTYVFIIALGETGAQLFLLIYFWAVPRLACHTILVATLFLTGNWLLSLLAIPLLVWWGREYYKVPRSNLGVFEPTEMYTQGRLKKHMRDTMISICYHLTFFFVYLYCCIIAMIKDKPIAPEVLAGETDDIGL